jgi:hypothetical protein
MRALRTTICALLGASTVAACGVSGDSGDGAGNGEASKAPNTIVRDANNAIAHASAVHVAGSISNNGVPLTLDLQLVSGKGGAGQLSEAGLSFRVIAVGQSVYIQGTPAFWRHFAGPAVARALDGRWLKAPAAGQFAPIVSLTNMQQLFSRVLLSHGVLRKDGTTTINGRRVVAVRDSTEGGTLYVAATGPPYPVEVIKRGAGGGRIIFDRINEPVTLSAPAHARDLSQFH